jgi:cyclopropane-fatty-acyl-phospholipid synthase
MNDVSTTAMEGDGVAVLNRENATELLKGAPAHVRAVLGRLTHLERGSLALTLPDGRCLSIRGRLPGPDADVTMKNWNLIKAALSGGAIGVAETYMEIGRAHV